MVNQHDINPKMRSILVDWLVEVHNKFKLHACTLWLSINILDRYLEKEQTHRSKLQLAGVTSLLIACKYEEIFPPEVKDCVYITDYAYTREEVLGMEFKILNTLNYLIFVPTGYHFMIRYLNIINACDRIRYLTYYYSERNLQEYDMLHNKPHHFAAACLYCALLQSRMTILQHNHYTNSNTIRNESIWTLKLQEESGLSENELKNCAKIIMQHVSEEPETASKRRLIAAKKKYLLEKYQSVAELALPVIPSNYY